MNHYQDFTAPYIKDPRTGVEIGGNCTFIHEMYVEYNNAYQGHSYIDPSAWEEINFSKPLERIKWRDNGYTNQSNLRIEINSTTVRTTSTVTTAASSTSTTTCPTCHIPDCKCECEICPKCPTCNYEFNKKQIDWMLNYKPNNFGSGAYQSGAFDCKDEWLEYFDIEGRPKFRSRPSPTGGFKPVNDDLICFKDLGNYFIINRSTRVFNNSLGEEIERKMWGWNDEKCKSSWLRVNRL
jgi:hypothetical protein